MCSLIDFYENRPNPSGYTFDQVIGESDEFWEIKHDYIQWLFPNKEPSKVNLSAPILDNETIKYLVSARGDENLYEDYENKLKYRIATERFGQFLFNNQYWTYPEDHEYYDSDPELNYYPDYWFMEPNHNHLRITRVIHFLNANYSIYDKMNLFTNILNTLNKNPAHGVPDSTLLYWTKAYIAT